MHIADPDSLSNEEWCARVKELQWIREQEDKANAKLMV